MDVTPTLPDRTDLVVVGGGIMGTSIAYFLAEKSDRDVALFERDNIASGSTGDSSAILRHHYGDQRIYSRMAWWSHEFYREFEERTGQPIAHEDSPLVRFGEEGTPTVEYALDGHDVLSSLDIPVTRHDSDDLPEKYPMYESLDQYDFAISDDDAGYSDGTDAAGGFARAADAAGATVITGVSIDGIETEEGTVVAVDTDRGRVDCEGVVLAAGPWTPRLATDVGVDLPITPTREQIIILDPPKEYADKYPDLVPTNSLPGGEYYLRPDFGEGVLVATHFLSEEVDPDTYDQQPDEETLLDLTGIIAEDIPELADAELRGQYCGVYSTTPDHDFIIDQAGAEGCYFCCGFSGHGFKHGPAVGKLVRDLVVDGDSELADLEFFSLSRFDADPQGHGKPVDNI